MHTTVLVLGAVVAIALMALATVAFWPSPTKKAVAYFPLAVHLYPGSDVDVLGVKVGTVTAVTPEATRVKVVMQYDAGRRIPAGATAIVDEPTLVALADKHGRTVAQVVLRWQLDLGNVVIPKSVHRERLASNLEVFDFALDADDLAVIAALESGERTGKNPDLFF